MVYLSHWLCHRSQQPVGDKPMPSVAICGHLDFRYIKRENPAKDSPSYVNRLLAALFLEAGDDGDDGEMIPVASEIDPGKIKAFPKGTNRCDLPSQHRFTQHMQH
jgi:hypothetical protein